MTSSAPLDAESDALPRRFGPYLLFDKIGEGGMARVYLARTTTGLGGERLTVVKQILPILSTSRDFCQLLIDEAKLCSRLSHKNIVQVTDLGREDDVLFIVMEYIEGLDLRELLRLCSKNRVVLPVEFALYVVSETLRALEYAHRKKDDAGNPLGVVHRDVSPSNILLSIEGEVKLCDFGIARALTSSELLPDEVIQGKAGYMSPETANGDVVDARSDVFAAGIILHELLSGRRLYRAGTGRPQLFDQAKRAEIPPLPARDLPDEARLYAIVMKALARRPDERHESAHAMLGELSRYVMENRLTASPLRFGAWLTEHFGAAIVERRRERERVAKELDEPSGRRPANEPRSLEPSDSEPDEAAENDDAPPAGQAGAERPPPKGAPSAAPGAEQRASASLLLVLLVIAVIGAALSLLVR